LFFGLFLQVTENQFDLFCIKRISNKKNTKKQLFLFIDTQRPTFVSLPDVV